jgi:Fe-S oxidoreductase
MYNAQDIIGLIAANVKKTRNPFGVPNSTLNTWWRGYSRFTRRPGDALLFTGLMYQAIPFIEATTRVLSRYEGTHWATSLRFGRLTRYIPSFLVGRGLSSLTSKADKQQFNGILQTICRLLRESGVSFFYHPDMDFYSGILLYDLGDQEGFEEHARFVARTLKLHGVDKIITVDPHTTYALKELYPRYTGVSFDVQPYFALLQPKPVSGGNGKLPVAIHDPCFYGRYLKLSDGPRQVLTDLGRVHLLLRRPGRVGVSGSEPGDPGPASGRAEAERGPGYHLLPHLSGQPAQGGPGRGGPGQPSEPLLATLTLS